MTIRPPARRGDAGPGDSQLRLTELIRTTLLGQNGGELLLVAQSGASPVAKALLATGLTLRSAAVTVRIVFTREDESLADFVTNACGPLDGVKREVRVCRNPRLRDAHEQLVIAASLVWHGDSMRRDLNRRDVMHQIVRGPGDQIRQAVRTFELLWVRSEPIFSCVLDADPRTDSPPPPAMQLCMASSTKAA